MKKIVIAACLSLGMLSNTSFAQPVIGTDQCIQPADWKIAHRFPNIVLHCTKMHISCTLVDVSGGDPATHTFYDNTYWTFKKNGIVVRTGECTSNQTNCAINYADHSCAYLYLMNVLK